MPGETVSDQRIQSPEESYKVNVFIFSLDTVTTQFQERFTVLSVRLMKEMQIFSTNALTSDAAVSSEHDIVGLCDLYSLETAQVVRELREFRNVYSTLKDLVKIDDLIIKTKDGTNKATNKAKNDVKDDNGNVADTENDDDDHEILEINEDDPNDDDQTAKDRWIDCSFIKPLRLLLQLSGFPNLICIYKILVSLAVTSVKCRTLHE